MNTIKTKFASSVDPSQVSLTISSATKMVIFLVGYFAAVKGFDPATATTNVQAISDIALSLVPACFALYHGLMTIYGIIRKLFVVKGVDNQSSQVVG